MRTGHIPSVPTFTGVNDSDGSPVTNPGMNSFVVTDEISVVLDPIEMQLETVVPSLHTFATPHSTSVATFR